MTRFVTGKMKRKGIDEVYDDFSYLSLSAPSAKTRRLDVELLPFMESPERAGWPVLENQQLERFACDAMEEAPQISMTPIPPPSANEERALVLYKPLHPQFNPSLRMDPKLVRDLKNPSFWSGNQNPVEDIVEEHRPTSANHLAVVPWVPSVAGPTMRVAMPVNGAAEESAMEAAEGPESMEIEESGQSVDAGIGAGGFRQWQQHCMVPELSHITSTPALGSW